MATMNNQHKVIINSKLLSEKNSVGGFFSDVLDATFGVGGMLGPTREEKAEADEAIKGGYKSIYAYRKAQEEKAAKENIIDDNVMSLNTQLQENIKRLVAEIISLREKYLIEIKDE